MVPQASAVVPGATNAEVIQLNKSHHSMIKFDSESDEDFLTVSGQLSLMTFRAAITIKQRWNEQNKGKLIISSYFIL